MCALTADEMRRDEALQYALAHSRRYREAALREVQAENRPKLMATVQAVQDALAEVKK